MATLSKDPRGLELEDFIAAHFASRGCYVETGVKERNPDEILELDIFWTSYHRDPPISHPVEIKSGEWGLGDVFKFYGWTRYLGLGPGQFVHKEPNGRLKDDSLKHIQTRTGIKFIHIPSPQDADVCLKSLGLPESGWDLCPRIWRYSFWLQRRLLKSISEAIRNDICPTCARAAKEYHQLINDAVFFLPDIRDRINALLTAHLKHQRLARSAAYELETNTVEFDNPPETKTFKNAYFQGKWFPVQACLYLAHRARLYILKAVVDYWIARERGALPKTTLKVGDQLIELTSDRLTRAMASGIEELSASASFRLLPVFWQVFMWGWGGFLLTDRLKEEYEQLSHETGVPVEEIPVALSAFDRIFPTPQGWFRQPNGDSRRVLVLMPPAMRGLGAIRRLMRQSVDEYSKLGYADQTGPRMASDHNVGVRLLDGGNIELIK